MKIIKDKLDGDIITQWNLMWKDNPALSPYMSYHFQKIYWMRKWFGRKRFGTHSLLLRVIDDDKRTKCLIPLIYKDKNFYISGDLCSSGELDFVYYKSNEEEMDCYLQLCLNFFREHSNILGGYLHINKVNENSKLYSSLIKIFLPESETVCVTIPFNSGYEKWFGKLSKSVRQNIRTAKNRLHREGLKYELCIYINEDVPKSVMSELMEVYNERLSLKTGESLSIIGKTVRRYLNPVTVGCGRAMGNFVSILRIQKEAAAFCMGLESSDGARIIVPRLAILDKYKLYSPGSLLIDASIAWLEKNSSVRYLDLSRGNEKYKYVLGGKEYKIYNFNIKL